MASSNSNCRLITLMTTTVLLFFVIATAIAALRTIYVILSTFRRSKRGKGRVRLRKATPASVCVVVGSGGHTTEMFGLLDKLPLERYHPRHYIVAATDKISVGKAEEYESRHGTGDSASGNFVIHRIPRSREVRQSFISAIFTTLWATLFAIRVMWRVFPDLVGFPPSPGTTTPRRSD